MAEQWLPVVGYEGLYEVSSLGRVRNARTGKAKASRDNGTGYRSVHLYSGGRLKALYVHRLVLLAFVGPCPEGCEARHLDSVRSNNALTNLAWGTKVENMIDQILAGNHAMARKTHCPRGHALDGTNIEDHSRRTGTRKCLACSRARSLLNQRRLRTGEAFTERDLAAYANRYHEKIMEESA